MPSDWKMAADSNRAEFEQSCKDIEKMQADIKRLLRGASVDAPREEKLVEKSGAAHVWLSPISAPRLAAHDLGARRSASCQRCVGSRCSASTRCSSYLQSQSNKPFEEQSYEQASVNRHSQYMVKRTT